MKRYSTIVLLIVVLTSHYLSAKNFWQKTSGPESGEAIVTAIVTGSSGMIFLGTELTGVYKSTNNGGNWIESNNGLTNRHTLSLAIRTGGYVYAGTPAGLFISSDNGSSWNSTAYKDTVYCIYVTTQGNIRIGTEDGIYLSTNSGFSFAREGDGLEKELVTTIAINSTGKIFAGTNGSSLWTSSDGGSTWELSTIELSWGMITSMAISSTGVIYVGTIFEGIHRSNDAGTTWTQTQFDIYLDAYCIATGPGTTLYVGSDVIYKSTNSGTAWTELNLPKGFVNSIAINPAGDIFAGAQSSGGGIYRSTNSGNTWTDLNKGFTNLSILSLYVGNKLYATSDKEGVFTTIDNGDSWVRAGLDTFTVNSVYEKSSSNYLAATDKYGIYEVTGATATPRGLTGKNVHFIKSNNNRLYAGTDNSGLYYSTDNGASWLLLGLDGMTVNDILLIGNNIFTSTKSYGIQKSTNNGTDWEQAGLSGISVTSFTSIGQNIWAGTENQGIYLSTDSGLNWTQSNNAFKTKTVSNIISVNDYYIFASAEGSVYYSSDSGITWISEMSVINTPVSSFGVANSYVFAGTLGSGVFRSADVIPSAQKQIYMTVTRTGHTTCDWGDTVKFEVKVFDEKQAVVSGVDVKIVDDLTPLTTTLTTEANGRVYYIVIIPQSKSEQIYSVQFSTSKTGYIGNPKDTQIIDVKHKIINMSVISSSKTVCQWGDTVNFEVSLYDEKSVPITGVIVGIKDSLTPFIGSMADNNGMVYYQIVVPNSKPDGIYDITFSTSKSGYNGFCQITKQIEVKNSNNEKRILAILPAMVQTKAQGDSLTYSISVKDSSGLTINGALIDIINEATNSLETVITDTQGKAKYSFKIPGDLAEGKYTIRFYSGSSDTVRRVIQVTKKVSVYDNLTEGIYDIFPNPASDRATIRLSNVGETISQIGLYNQAGKKIAIINNSISNPLLCEIDLRGLSQGLYYVIIKTEKKSKVLKLNIIK